MTVTEKLQSLLNKVYTSANGEQYTCKQMPGLTDKEIDNLASQLPSKQISTDIKELLKFAKGFTYNEVEEIRFDAFGQFGFENIFPFSIQLGDDGLGNFWILDIDSKGNWGSVFYVCHDPAVVVKHSDNLLQFIEHIEEYCNNEEESNHNIIYNKTVIEIWEQNNGFMQISEARNSNTPILKNFALTLPDEFVIADLQNKPNKSGFAWGKFGSDIDKTVRCEDNLIWAIKKIVKKGFFSRLFG